MDVDVYLDNLDLSQQKFIYLSTRKVHYCVKFIIRVSYIRIIFSCELKYTCVTV